MGFFDFLSAPKPIAGEIGYHKLADWWRNELTEAERRRILEVFRPLNSGGSSLTEGKIISSSESTLAFLSALAGWFKKEEDRKIGYKILQRAEQCVSTTRSVLDVHFFYQTCIEMHYRDRADEEHLMAAERACREQIAMAKRAAKAFKRDGMNQLPEHVGYKQLTILLEGRGLIEEAIAVAKQAKAEGWAGDWERRIERYSKK